MPRTLYFVGHVLVEDDYPSKPTHQPMKAVIEDAICDALHYKDGVRAIVIKVMDEELPHAHPPSD
jgi:hypothetical protein